MCCCTLLFACSPKYPRSREQVLQEQKSHTGEIVLIQGADGPYKVGPVYCWSKGGAMSYKVDGQNISYPADPGYTYCAYSYLNAEDKALVIVRKVSESAAASTNTEESGLGLHKD